MFPTKQKALSLSLLLYTTLALILATGSDAKEYAPAHVQRRGHFNLNRFIKKRALASDASHDGVVTVFGTQSSPTAANTQPVSVSPTSNTPANVQTQTPSNTPSASPQPSASANNNDPLGLNSILSSLTAVAPTSSSTPIAGAISLISASSSSSSSSTTPTTSALPTSQTPAVITSSSPATTPASIAKVTITTSASEASSTASSTPSSSAKITRTTLTVLIIIAACVGGTAIIWTVIRKWKFRASSQFEDRMRPIDWQPTTSDDDGLPIHRRAGSSASSFHSGSGHEGLSGGYGSTSDHGHGRSVSPLPPLPDHDFTAPVANLAPVGGYADLARGPSPQPQMQEALARGPSMRRPQYDQYGVPLHHQGGYGTQDAYDYNGAARY